ncbi:hypothetical protein PO878_04045 [Iamia majanohamensis]|uniref:Uncharacterized protein n=1 Tax=Iamia majanohamensis TaxID=467976 RepID=A0AAE9Y710_9ACTN|nr:hypothetical protein [Iamia majanohamensis]WCO67894.1 hypothetical protein PO878_04045 [Iamia majanohamensis]
MSRTEARALLAERDALAAGLAEVAERMEGEARMAVGSRNAYERCGRWVRDALAAAVPEEDTPDA